MTTKSVFFPDDLDRINSKYFSELRQKGMIKADPSYWYQNFSEVAKSDEFCSFKSYKSDYYYGLKNEKPIIVDALSAWDDIQYGYDDITLCSSATSASFILLSYIKSILGINDIYFETPCYFASLKQAELLDFNINLIPTYADSEFEAEYFFEHKKRKKIIWITQPRYGLGTNQNIKKFESLLEKCGEKDLIVVDEATEQMVPSILSKYNIKSDPRIVKIRSPFKPLGINGPRLSSIIHGEVHRKNIQNVLEQVQGSIDIFSLEFSAEVLSNKDRFFDMLFVANSQIREIYKKVLMYSKGTCLVPSKMENGYIGSISVEFEENNYPYTKKRERILQYCRDQQVPIILGSNMKFAKDPCREFIRLNYFSNPEELLSAIKIFSKISIS